MLISARMPQSWRGDELDCRWLTGGPEAILRRLPHLDPSLIKVPISERAFRSFAFWLEFFQSWDRTLVVVQDFGPCSTWQVFGRTDASTEWGHGGFAMSSSSFVFLNAPWSPAERALAFVESRESTGVFELLAIKHWLSAFSTECTGKRVLLDATIGNPCVP